MSYPRRQPRSWLCHHTRHHQYQQPRHVAIKSMIIFIMFIFLSQTLSPGWAMRAQNQSMPVKKRHRLLQSVTILLKTLIDLIYDAHSMTLSKIVMKLS